MKKYIISVDQGTTSSKILLYDTKFKVVDKVQKEFKQYFPKNGWVEHDALEIWNDIKKLIRSIIKRNKINAYQILSIGIANQRETTVLWNKKTGKPVYKAIVWQDRRTANYCNKLKKLGYEKKISQSTGLLLDPYFSATKIKWIIENNKKIKELIKNKNLLFGTIDTWILWNLTEGRSHLTDITNASRTMLFNIKKEIWSKELLAIFNIPHSILPKVVENIYNFGDTSLFGNKINIGAMAGDQQAASIGQACIKSGQSKSTYGTGCFLLMNIGEKFKISKNRLLTTVTYKINGKKMLSFEGSIFDAGSAIQWLRDKLNFFKESSETEKFYIKANKNENIVFVPALTGIGAPYWNPYVRGAIFGITRNTSIEDIVKATLKGIAYQTLDLINCMQKDSKKIIHNINVDGGMTGNKQFLQTLANILQIKIIKSKNIESTSLGAGFLAGLSCGIIKDVNELENFLQNKSIFIPKKNKLKIRKEMKIWKDAIKKLIN